MKPIIKATIIKEQTGYSAFVIEGDKSIFAEGEHFNELKKNLIEAINFTFQPEGYNYTIQEIRFAYDLESFFDFYRVINASVLAKRIGMNQSLLAQYISGTKKPSPNQVKRILTGVHQIGHELTEVDLLQAP